MQARLSLRFRVGRSWSHYCFRSGSSRYTFRAPCLSAPCAAWLGIYSNFLNRYIGVVHRIHPIFRLLPCPIIRPANISTALIAESLSTRKLPTISFESASHAARPPARAPTKAVSTIPFGAGSTHPRPSPRCATDGLRHTRTRITPRAIAIRLRPEPRCLPP